jgi:regulator of protease activity HflC (stomatin/prohibitin superfamily)
MIPFIIILLFGTVVAAKCVHVIPSNQRYVIYRLGKFHRIVGPGLSAILPVMDRVVARYSLDPQEIRVSYERGDLVIRYRILDPKKAFTQVADLRNAIEQSARTAMKSISEKPLTDVFARRELAGKIDGILENFGVKVIEVE